MTWIDVLFCSKQARSKYCMVGPAEINMKLPDGGLGGTFQKKYNENGFNLLTIGGEQACCRTVALLITPKSDCVVQNNYDRLDYWSGQNRTNRTVCYGPAKCLFAPGLANTSLQFSRQHTNLKIQPNQPVIQLFDVHTPDPAGRRHGMEP